MAAIFIGLLFVSITKFRIKKKSTYVLLAITSVIYVYLLWVMKIPEEKIHFLEYGLLGFLVFRAFQLDFTDKLAYLLAFCLTAAFGWGDEGIQYLLPNRYFEWKDVLLNIVGGALGLFWTFLIRREGILRKTRN